MNSTIEYNGHTITVTDDYRFAISGPTIETDDNPGRLVYDSVFTARERIDEIVRQTERQNRQKLIRAVGQSGGTGRGNGQMLTKKKFQDMLNQADLDHRAAQPQKDLRYHNNRFHQKTRLYGDYLRSQDPNMFNENYRQYLSGQHQHLKQYE